MAKSTDIVRYNPSDYDLHPGLKLVLGGRKIWKEKIRNAGYSNEIITWVFEDGTTESYIWKMKIKRESSSEYTSKPAIAAEYKENK